MSVVFVMVVDGSDGEIVTLFVRISKLLSLIVFCRGSFCLKYAYPLFSLR